MNGLVVSNIRLNNRYYIMGIKSEEFVSSAKVGQFTMLNPNIYSFIYDPLLRRPFSICDIEGDSFKILIQLVGKGTSLLKNIKADTRIEFSSPMGNGFSIVNNKSVAVIAGGVGIAPFLWLTKKLKENYNKIDLFYGGKTSKDIVLTDRLKEYVDSLYVSTEDGSMGSKGLVTESFVTYCKTYDKIYSCGPKKMLRHVSKIGNIKRVKTEVSIDEKMACGIGACLGCMVYTNEKGSRKQVRCCHEGPVFDGNNIDWDKICN